MERRVIDMLSHARAVWFLFIVLLFVLTTSHPASAQTQWTKPSVYQAWIGYNNMFYAKGANGGHIVTAKQSGSTSTSFWEEAEEIEIADDAYDWSIANDPTNDHSKYVDEINNLCTGFVDNMPSRFVGPGGKYDWSGDLFNDDLDWAVIAFVRAYQITGNSSWLAAAETNFNTVWTRGQAPGGQGNGLSGLIQSQPHGSKWSQNLDSPVNFTFVIAGYLLYDNTRDVTYKQEADNVYSWAIDHLYSIKVNGGVCNGHPGLTCAKIFDSTTGHSDYTYNYGIAIQAATRAGDSIKAQYIADWLMYNSNNPNYPYAGTYTFRGVQYNVLPNYHQGGNNDDGYNGIALRGVGFGYSRGTLNATTLAWAQANLQAAWELRNSADVMWNDWDNQPIPLPVTPNSGLYSWDCSSAIAGMLDIPTHPMTQADADDHSGDTAPQ
ncbi:MAG TPA: hypothetical protein VND66_06810 [Acidobacteriaceae bacterium]|nr:hypothetical protein [Acidobacteriaceae bacterium]